MNQKDNEENLRDWQNFYNFVFGVAENENKEVLEG